jgi:PTH1 family peptidyl-tRNA hydrolase
MIVFVGLGNPGTNYTNTRHNVGFMAVDMISDRYNFIWSHKPKFDTDVAVGECELGKVVLCKPTTFMNLSGSSVQSILSFYKVPLEKLIVIHDDLDLVLGAIRHKLGGGAGGHNGLKSIDKLVGNNYQRLRIGIGRPDHPAHDVSDYVLGKFSGEEEQIITERLRILVDNLKKLADGDLEGFKAAVV